MNLTHLHLITTHIPATMVVIGALAIIVALFRRSDDLHRCALILFFTAALIAIAAYVTGDSAVESMKTAVRIPPTDEMDRHSELAAITLGVVVFQGCFALATLLVVRKKPLGKRLATASLAFSLVSVALLAWTAQLGADIRHPELRTASGRQR